MVRIVVGITMCLIVVSINDACAEVTYGSIGGTFAFDLTAAGYSATAHGIRRILEKEKENIPLCESALSFAVEKGYTEVIPDIRRFEEHFSVPGVEQWRVVFACSRCLFRLDKNMTPHELATRLASITPHVNDDLTLYAYPAFIDAHEYQSADIRDKLLELSLPDAGSGDWPVQNMKRLFSYYGNDISTSDIGRLRDAWSKTSPIPEKIRLMLGVMERGYPPTVEGMRLALKTREHALVIDAIRCILLSRLDARTLVRGFLNELDLGISQERQEWLAGVVCLFTIDMFMEETEIDERLGVIRRLLYDGNGCVEAYGTLLAIAGCTQIVLNRPIDIKPDLLRLAHPGNPLPDMKEKIVNELFARYGESVREQELAELKSAWQGNDTMLALIATLESKQRATRKEQLERIQQEQQIAAASKASPQAPSFPWGQLTSAPRTAYARGVFVVGMATAASALVAALLLFLISRSQRRQP